MSRFFTYVRRDVERISKFILFGTSCYFTIIGVDEFALRMYRLMRILSHSHSLSFRLLGPLASLLVLLILLLLLLLAVTGVIFRRRWRGTTTQRLTSFASTLQAIAMHGLHVRHPYLDLSNPFESGRLLRSQREWGDLALRKGWRLKLGPGLGRRPRVMGVGTLGTLEYCERSALDNAGISTLIRSRESLASRVCSHHTPTTGCATAFATATGLGRVFPAVPVFEASAGFVITFVPAEFGFSTPS